MNLEELYRPLREKYFELKDALEKEDLANIIEQTLTLHAMVHPRLVSSQSDNTIADYVLDYMMVPGHKEILVPRMNCEIDLNWAGAEKVPLCWQFWHLYRIEDLVANILIANQEQIFNGDWCRRINAPITDTGNALTASEAIDFGRKIDAVALRDYMIEVGRKTREVVKNISLEGIRTKPAREQLDRIREEGGVTGDKRSAWLLDYWGSLTVSGMILTPLTDHHMMHLPACLEHLPIFDHK